MALNRAYVSVPLNKDYFINVEEIINAVDAVNLNADKRNVQSLGDIIYKRAKELIDIRDMYIAVHESDNESNDVDEYYCNSAPFRHIHILVRNNGRGLTPKQWAYALGIKSEFFIKKVIEYKPTLASLANIASDKKSYSIHDVVTLAGDRYDTIFPENSNYVDTQINNIKNRNSTYRLKHAKNIVPYADQDKYDAVDDITDVEPTLIDSTTDNNGSDDDVYMLITSYLDINDAIKKVENLQCRHLIWNASITRVIELQPSFKTGARKQPVQMKYDAYQVTALTTRSKIRILDRELVHIYLDNNYKMSTSFIKVDQPGMYNYTRRYCSFTRQW